MFVSETKADVRRFLDGIRKEFLSSVNVDESGLMDELVQTGVLNYDSDVESLRCKYSVRKDKARFVYFTICRRKDKKTAFLLYELHFLYMYVCVYLLCVCVCGSLCVTICSRRR